MIKMGYRLGKMLLAIAVIILGILYFKHSVSIEQSKHWFPSHYRANSGADKIVKTITFENELEYYKETYSGIFELLEIEDNIGWSDVKELRFEQYKDGKLIECLKYSFSEIK